MIARALARRCPLCGNPGVFETWSRMKHSCGRCGHVFAREEGYWVGAIIVNLAVAETLFGILFVGTIIFTLPDVPWQPLLVVALVTNAIVPVVFYPFSKTVWVAIDVFFTRSRSAA
jgi:uncharacterized protein (DUF983 family)